MTASAQLLLGAPVATKIYAECKAGISMLADKAGIVPCLAFILVGNNRASEVYVGRKQQACKKLGINSQVIRLDCSVSQEQLLDRIKQLNSDPAVSGILVQQPLPASIDTSAIVCAVDPHKDVDGFHPQNLGALVSRANISKQPSLAADFDCDAPLALYACTPQGIMLLLADANIPIAGKRAVVIGRSLIVGKPIAALLINASATVVVCNSQTPTEELTVICRQADIIVSAVGKAGLITDNMIKPNAAVIDVGINVDENGKLCGDVDHEPIRQIASWITPVPGGVGPMTVAMLMFNTVRAAISQYATQGRKT